MRSSNGSAVGASTPPRARRAALAGVLTGVVLMAAAGVAEGAHLSALAPARVTAASSTFCQEADVFGKTSVGSNLMTLTPATLKSDYAKFKAAQPTILANTPASIKTDLEKIFAFDDGIFDDLSKVGWVFGELTAADLHTLALDGPKLKPQSDAVVSYLDKTCGLKLLLP